MKKFVLLASLMALAALSLAATPAFAQDNGDGGDGGFEPVTICHRVGGPQEFEVITVDDEATLEGHLAHPGDIIPATEECLGDGNGNGNGDGDGDDDNGDDDNNEGIIDRDRFNVRDVGNVDVTADFDVSQETEQDCRTGDVSQPIDVNSGGDNSITTVGLQPTANTGCAQNATGILDFDPIVAGFGGDTLFNVDDTNVVIRDDDCDGEDDDGDGNRDEDCDDNGNHNGNHNGDDDDDDNGDDNVVDINDRDVFRLGGDDININGGGGDDFDVDTDSTIDISPSLDVDGGGTIYQNAEAESNTTYVVKHHPYWYGW